MRKFPVRLWEVSPKPGSKPNRLRDFSIESANNASAKRDLRAALEKRGRFIRSISFDDEGGLAAVVYIGDPRRRAAPQPGA